MFTRIIQIKKAPKTIKRISQSYVLNNTFFYRAIASFDITKKQIKGLLLNCQNMYVDVSIFAKNDNKTGIQRVVREVIFQLLLDGEINYRLKFVLATKSVFYRHITHEIVGGELRFLLPNVKEKPIVLGEGDAFIGLDFCPNIIPFHLFALMHSKRRGARFFWILYDLLPLHHPSWFTDGIKETFEPWLRSILLLSDVVLCISHTVKTQVQAYADQIGVMCDFSVIRLGYDFRKLHEISFSDSISDIVQGRFSDVDFVLMVGTLEPRKGHADIVSAFCDIQQNSLSEVVLLIVGQKGWGMDEFIKKINQSNYKNKVFWINSVNDELLTWLYKHSLGVVVASYDEGYGLPLAEAMAYEKHIFARHIDIFKEVADDYPNIKYFSKNNEYLKRDMQDWLIKTISNPVVHFELNNGVSTGWENTLLDIKREIGL